MTREGNHKIVAYWFTNSFTVGRVKDVIRGPSETMGRKITPALQLHQQGQNIHEKGSFGGKGEPGETFAYSYP